jgi:hypothetical protein
MKDNNRINAIMKTNRKPPVKKDPYASKTYVAKSNIEGKGLFANKKLKQDQEIGTAHIDGNPTFVLGNYHNHSENPNIYSVLENGIRKIYALRDIEPGEELTIDYRMQPELGQPEEFENDAVEDEYPSMQEGGWLDQYQNGGRAPIYVTNPRDPRYTAYSDSLALHNSYLKNLDRLKKLGLPVTQTNDKDWGKLDYNPFMQRMLWNNPGIRKSAKDAGRILEKNMYDQWIDAMYLTQGEDVFDKVVNKSLKTPKANYLRTYDAAHKTIKPVGLDKVFPPSVTEDTYDGTIKQKKKWVTDAAGNIISDTGFQEENRDVDFKSRIIENTPLSIRRYIKPVQPVIYEKPVPNKPAVIESNDMEMIRPTSIGTYQPREPEMNIIDVNHDYDIPVKSGNQEWITWPGYGYDEYSNRKGYSEKVSEDKMTRELYDDKGNLLGRRYYPAPGVGPYTEILRTKKYGGDPSLSGITGHYQNGGSQTPEAWEKEIRDIEHQIGPPDEWTMDGYNLLQNKLNEYKYWRENTPEGKAVIDYHNEPNEYVIPLPPHLTKIPKAQYGKNIISDTIVYPSDNPYAPGLNKEIIDAIDNSMEQDNRRWLNDIYKSGMSVEDYYNEYPDEDTYNFKTRDKLHPYPGTPMKKGGSTPRDSKLYSKVLKAAKKKFKVWPNPFAKAWVESEYKRRGGDYNFDMKWKYGKGGKTPPDPDEARDMLLAGTAHGHPLTARQRQYLSEIAGTDINGNYVDDEGNITDEYGNILDSSGSEDALSQEERYAAEDDTDDEMMYSKFGGWLKKYAPGGPNDPKKPSLQDELNPNADPRFKLVRPEDKKANQVVFDVDPFTGKARQREYANLEEVSVSPKTEIEEKDKEWRANAAKYSIEDWFNKYMPNIGLARAMGVNPNNLSDQQKQEYRTFIDTKTAEDIMRRKPLQGQSELDYANWFKNLTQGEKDLISRTSYAGRGMLDTPAKFQGIDFAKAQAANRMLESVNAENEDLFGNPNWRDVLRRRTQATGDKLSLRRIPGIGEYIPEIFDVTGDIGRMASALGASPAEAQEQNSIMPYITSVGNPILQGTVGKFLNPKATNLQFFNEMINPLAGLTEHGIDKATSLGRKLKGSKVASGVAGFKPVDLSSISGTISKPVPMASLKTPTTAPLSPAQAALEKRFAELNKLNLENRNLTDFNKYYDQLNALEKQAKITNNLSPEELKKILSENPNIKIQEDYVSTDLPEVGKAADETIKKQDELFDEATQFSKDWIYKDSKRADEILNELELHRDVKFSEADKDRIAALNKQLEGLNYSKSRADAEKANEIFREIDYIQNPYYEAHSNKIEALENELFNTVRPEFIERINNLRGLTDAQYLSAPGNERIYENTVKRRILEGAKSYNKKFDSKLIRLGEGFTEDAYNKLSDYSKDYLSRRAPDVGGFRNQDDVITLGEEFYDPYFRLVQPYPQKIEGRRLKDIFTSPEDFIRGYRMVTPDPYVKKEIAYKLKDPLKAAGTGVHESGHLEQDVFGYGDILSKYDDKYNYYSHKNTPFGDKFGEHLIDPVEVPKDAKDYDYQTWLSSGKELSSETKKARFKLYNQLVNNGLDPEKAMQTLQKPTDGVLDILLEDFKLDDHFKPNAPKEVKREVLKKFIPVIGGIGLGAYAIDQAQEPPLSNKYGGWLNKYQ